MSALPAFKIEMIGAPGSGETHRVTDWHLPVHVDAVNDHWLGIGRGAVLYVTVQRSARDAEWAALGEYLVNGLLQSARFVGICLEGQYPATDLAMEWVNRLMGEDGSELTLLGLRWRDWPWKPQSTRGLGIDLTVIRETKGVEWLSKIWTHVDSGMFDYAASLMILAYEEDMPSVLSPGPFEPLTVDAMTRSLEHASGWLIAGDGWGYIVGLAQDSALARMLRIGQSRETAENQNPRSGGDRFPSQ